MIDKLRKQTLPYTCDLIDAKINNKNLYSLTEPKNYLTRATYYRLFVPNVVNDKKALLLDSDLVVNGSIKELYEIDISNYLIGAVESIGGDHYKDLGLKQKADYFNAGVMLINLELWRKHNLTDKVINYMLSYPKNIRFADQCGLNAIVNGNWKRVPAKYNLTTSLFRDPERFYIDGEELKEARLNPIIIHYTGPSKPWQFKNKHPYKRLYWQYLKMTPFFSVIPEKITLKGSLSFVIPKRAIELLRSVKRSLKRR